MVEWPPDTIVADRFRILEPIGRGGMGEVFKAEDLETGQLLAVKRLTAACNYSVLRREFHTLEKLRHPNILEVYALYDDYYTMPLVQGRPLDVLARRGQREIITIAIEITKALVYIHSQAVVHGDLKPQNIFLLDRPPGARRSVEKVRLRIMDFGLAQVRGDGAAVGEADELTGTPAYLAPEAILNGTADSRGDLYALGVILQEMLTSHRIVDEECWRAGHDVSGTIESAYRIIGHHLKSDPRRPSELNADIDPLWDDVILKLLSKQPEERYQSARELLSVLANMGGRPEDAGDVYETGAAYLFPPSFVGREPDLEQLLSWLSFAPRAEAAEKEGARDREDSGILFVTGELGIGKTQLLQECQRQVSQPDRSPPGRAEAPATLPRFLWGRCTNPLTSYQPFANIISTVLTTFGSAEPGLLEDLIASYGHEIIKVVPDLKRDPRLRGLKPAREIEPQYAKSRLFKHVFEFFVAIARTRPLVLLIDDAHLIDHASADLIEYISKLLAGEKVKIVLLEDAHSPTTTLGQIRKNAVAIELLPLGRTECSQLIDSMLGRSSPREALDEEIMKRARGNPALSVEMVRALADQGLIYREVGTWHVGIEDYGTLNLPAKVESAILSRAGALREEQKDLLNKLAVMKFRVREDLIARIVERTQRTPLGSAKASIRSGPGLWTELEALTDEGLLSRQQGEYCIADSSLQETLYKRIPPHARQKVHGIIAKELERLRRVGEEHPADCLAFHYQGAGDAKEALGYLILSGREAKETYANKKATSTLKLALRVLDEVSKDTTRDRRQKAELLMDLGEIEHRTGNLDEAIELYQLALRTTEDRLVCSSVYKQMSDVHAQRGDIDTSIDAGEKSLDLLGNSDQLERARLLNNLASLYEGSGDSSEARSLVGQALKLAKGGDDLALTVDILLNHAMVYGRLGEWDTAMKYIDISFTALANEEDLYLRAKASAATGRIYSAKGDVAQAIEYHQKALELVEQAGYLYGISAENNSLGLIYHSEGRFNEALHYYLRGLKAAETFGELDGLENLYGNTGLLYYDMEDFGRAERYLKKGLRLAKSRENTLAVATLGSCIGAITGQQGHEAMANGYLSASEEAAAKVGSAASLAQASLRIGTAYLKLGKLEAARAHLERAHDLAAATGLRKTLGAALRMLAQVFAQSGRLQDSEGLFGKAIRVLEEARAERFLAEAHLEYGRVLLAPEIDHRENEALRERGEQQIEIAYEIFGKVGASRGQQEAENVMIQHQERMGYPALKAMEDERNRLLRLQDINKAINSELDVQKLLNMIMDTAIDLANAERGFLLLSEKGKLSIHAARNIDRETVTKAEFKISHSIAEQVIEAGKPIITTDAQEDERFSEFISVHHLRLRSVVCIPFRIRDTVLGALYLDNRFQKGVFSEGTVKFLETFGDQAAIAIENARLYNENLDKQKELQRSKDIVEQLNKRLEDRLTKQSQELAHSRKQLQVKYNYGNIIGQSDAMQRVFLLLDKITDADVPVLIQGARGTGKELVARAIHYNGPRKDRPFHSENCSAFPEALLESELFGHVKGAFTGASSDKKGLFEAADGGTLFLDEIGDMSLDMQAKLLRVIEEGEMRPVGGQKVKKVNVRVTSASNKDLKRLVEERTFRPDLFDRLNVLSVLLPPLRDRKEDIPLLVQHFLERIARNSNTEPKTITEAAMHALVEYDWPGNVRELENEITRSVVLCPENDITAEDLTIMDADRATESFAIGHSLKAFLDVQSKLYIIKVLEESNWQRVKAAERLGIERTTLYKLMKKLGIEDPNAGN